jgi:hypothetical protein
MNLADDRREWKEEEIKKYPGQQGFQANQWDRFQPVRFRFPSGAKQNRTG